MHPWPLSFSFQCVIRGLKQHVSGVCCTCFLVWICVGDLPSQTPCCFNPPGVTKSHNVPLPPFLCLPGVLFGFVRCSLASLLRAVEIDPQTYNLPEHEGAPHVSWPTSFIFNEQMKMERILNKPLLGSSSEKKTSYSANVGIESQPNSVSSHSDSSSRTIKSFILEKKNAILVQRLEK